MAFENEYLLQSQIHLALPSFALDIAQTKISPFHMRQVLEGNKLSVSGALEAGYLSHVISADDIDGWMLQQRQDVATFGNEAYATTKQRLYAGIAERGFRTCREEFVATDMPGGGSLPGAS